MSRPKWRVASIIAGAIASVLGAGLVSGCSVVYDLSTEQCSSNADCDALGEAFVGLECRQNLCQVPLVTGCQSNAECMDDFAVGTEPWACVDRTCVELLTDECPVILPQTREIWRTSLRTADPPPLILAGTTPANSTASLDNYLRNYELALLELNEKGVTVGGRQVVMLGCKAQFESTDELDEMMEHLADEVKVPGMVTTLAADDLQRAFTEKGRATNMFFMSAYESDDTLAAIADNGLIWHIGPATPVLARVYGPLLTRILDRIEAPGTVKVATVVTTDYRFLTNMLPTIQAEPDRFGVRFNGQSVAANGTNYLAVGITNDPGASLAQQVDALLGALPTVIISLADGQFIERLVPAIESGWPAEGPPRPFYVLSPFNYNDGAVLDLIASNPSLVSRMAGVNGAAAVDATAYNSYLMRWNLAFPEAAGATGYENMYDAAYYLLYSAAAAGQGAPGGLNLVTGMNRLLRGMPVTVGPEALAQTVALLGANGSSTIQLNGTLGPPDFTVDGTRESVGSVYCVDGSGFHADVLRYVPNDADPTAATLAGDFTCIPDF
jgi:hypothetical protein